MNSHRLSLGPWAVLCGLLIALGGLCNCPRAGAATACPNEAFRTGPSAALPDCRAYELVSPGDANGRLLEGLSTFGFSAITDMFPTELGSPGGSSFIYMTYNSPLLSPGEASGTHDIYEARRSADGWQTVRRVTPSGDLAILPYPGGFSPDHQYTFVNVAPFEGGAHPGGSLAAAGTSDYLAAPDGSFELVGTGSLGSERLAQGRYVSDGGQHVIFVTGTLEGQSIWCGSSGSSGKSCEMRQLEPGAAPTGTGAIYDRAADGPTRVISLLPGDVPAGAGEQAFYQGASSDASVVAFTIGGTLYVRVENAKTLEVTKADSTYAGLSKEGRFLFYVSDGDVHRFDIETEEDDQVNSTGDGEVVNVSADGSHVYFISESQIGGEGMAGEPNLYVWGGVAPKYIATVAAEDLSGQPALTNWTSWAVNPVQATFALAGPGYDSSRTTPDGTVLAFQSKAQLTGYDNDGHTEIYRYDDGDESLTCVSCSPIAEPASGDARFQELHLVKAAIVVHNLSADGSRIFFETPEALVPEDGDGINDIYQWHAEEAVGSLDLISSGKSVEYPPLLEETEYFPTPNVLLSATPTGEDVFFLSQEALVPGAGGGGASAIYNARVGGGFPQPLAPPECSEESCRQALESAPSLPGSPQSEVFQGSGNVKLRKGKPHCHRAKQSKHRHCKKRQKRVSRRRSPMSAARAYASTNPGEVKASHTGASEETFSAASGATTASVSALAGDEFDEFDIETFAAEDSPASAGAHPDFTTQLAFTRYINKTTGRAESDARIEELEFSLPPGLLGNVNAIPKCKTGQLVAFGNCPIDSQVGIAKIIVPVGTGELTEPVYNLEPPHPEEEIARLGIFAAVLPVFIDVSVETAGDYGATATVHGSPGQVPLLKSDTTIWGNPADPIHDEERLTAKEATECATGTACMAPGGKRGSGLPPTAFLTNPSACQGMRVGLTVRSYQLPGQVFGANAPMAPITGCEGLPFDPSFKAEPTSQTAGATTGLKTTLVIPQQSLEDVDSPSTAAMREARVTLPKGMGIAAGAADGIAACGEDQVGYKKEVDAACPDASKVGTATISSDLLPHPVGAEVFLRTPTPGHQFGLWLVSDELGLHVKIPGEIEPDKGTGQLTAVFRDLPQVPVSRIDLSVWGGPRAPLVNPEACGTYATSYTFAPHSNDPSISGQSQMTIDQGCDKGFSPKLHAGTTNPTAGAFSPFAFDLEREDADQNLAALDITLPDGLLAKIKGVGLCPDSAAQSGNCPADSRIGSLTAAVGAGPDPLWIPQPGKSPTAIYFAGPYNGAPFSILAVVPAQAGPFDLGNVVVRSALKVDPETAEATVESDPLPRFVEGVAGIYRRIHVVVDRPEFVLNPTDCAELAITSKITSTRGAVASPSVRFQVDGCKALKFKPSISLTLKGGTERSDYPAISAMVKARAGDANIGRVSVALPHSEFLAQEHIVTICTRKQFVADKCPKGSVYGRAKAWTPLLAKPLEGPVYLRSSDNPLPDLVMSLEGEIDVALVGRIDSKNGGIRTTFDQVPDAPVTKFVLRMRGGKKSLLTNSTDICHGAHRATVQMGAQNGRLHTSRPLLKSTGCHS